VAIAVPRAPRLNQRPKGRVRDEKLMLKSLIKGDRAAGKKQVDAGVTCKCKT
jgi:hypothetical protein